MIDSKKLTVSFSRDSDIGQHPGIDGLVYYSVVMYLRKSVTPYNMVFTTLKEIILGCNDNPGSNRNNDKIKKYEDALNFMVDSGFIILEKEIEKYKFNEHMKISVDATKLFIKNKGKHVIMNCYDYDRIMQSKSKSKKTTMFAVYLHLCSLMFKTNDGVTIAVPNVVKMCDALGISHNTLNGAIDDLVEIGIIYKSPHTTYLLDGNCVNAKIIYAKTPEVLSKNFIINYWQKQLNTDYVKVKDK